MIVREVVPEALAGERVDRVVAMVTGLSRNEVAELVDAGAVRVGGEVVTTRSARLRAGDEVEVDVPEPADGGRARGRARRRRAGRARGRAPARDRQAGRAGGAPRRRPAHRHPRARPAGPLPRARAASATTRSGRASCTGSTRARPGCCSWPAPPTAYDGARGGAGRARRCTGGTARSVWGHVDAPRGPDRRADRAVRPRAHPHGRRRARQGGPHPLRGAAAASPSRSRSPSWPAPSRPGAPTRSACTCARSATRWWATRATAASASRSRWRRPFLHAERARARPPGHRRRRCRSTSPLPADLADGARPRSAERQAEVAARASRPGRGPWRRCRPA